LPQTIPANASIWYRYEYSGDGSEIVVRMPNGLWSGLSFELYTPQQAADWWTTGPIGRGTGTACGQEALYNDEIVCTGDNADDLLWAGSFPSGGTYFVRVNNPTPNPILFQLIVSGTGISVCGAPGQPVGQGEGTPREGIGLPCP
jgi:hypothetical protein